MLLSPLLEFEIRVCMEVSEQGLVNVLISVECMELSCTLVSAISGFGEVAAGLLLFLRWREQTYESVLDVEGPLLGGEMIPGSVLI